MIHTSFSIEETKSLAERFVASLKQRASSGISSATVVGFSGDLGSGKTAFTKCVAEILGIADIVTSPTFVIQKKYSIADEHTPFSTLIHIDAYRLNDENDLEALRFKRELEDATNLILIEWPEIVMEALPEATPIVRFSFVDEHVRSIEFPDMMGI